MNTRSSTSTLFVTWDGGGNLPPALGIAAEVERRGGTARILGHERQRAAVEAAGLRFQSFARGRHWDSSQPASTVASLRGLTGVFTDRGIAEDLLEAAAGEPTDAVVVDCLLFRAIQDAAASGLATVSLVHTFQQFLVGNTARGPIGLISSLRGVRPKTAWAAAQLSLICALAELDPATSGSLSPSALHIGPVWQGRPAPAVMSPGRPRVLVSLSTCWFPGQTETLQSVLDAVGQLEVDAVVTTGPSLDPAELRAAGNTEVLTYADHGELMKDVSLVVGHGGHSTAMRALSYDLPMLILPMHPMLDQSMVGQAIAACGAGRVLPRSAPPADIAAAVDELSHDGPHRTAAARLGAVIREHDGAALAVDRIEALVASRHQG